MNDRKPVAVYRISIPGNFLYISVVKNGEGAGSVPQEGCDHVKTISIRDHDSNSEYSISIYYLPAWRGGPFDDTREINYLALSLDETGETEFPSGGEDIFEFS